MRIPIKGITIGSDPELSIFKGSPLRRNFYGNGFIKCRKGLGIDGRVAEIRAKCSKNPLEHCENIKKSMKELVSQMSCVKENLECYSGNGVLATTGGHIHIGWGGKKVVVKRRITKIMDIMAIFLMPLEEKSSFLKRRKTSYGTLGDYSTKSYGLEYRTLGSFLYSEKDMRSIFCLAYVICHEAVNNPKFIDELISRVLKEYPNKNKFRTKYKEYNIKYFENGFNLYSFFMRNVRKMRKYSGYKSHIERLFRMHKQKKVFPICLKNGISKTWKFDDFNFKEERLKYKLKEKQFQELGKRRIKEEKLKRKKKREKRKKRREKRKKAIINFFKRFFSFLR